ncbi:30S ribosomal protein S14, chloroplastic [Capsicum annuum]|nr:30S ribosomal protein S14, chloroplastic [Capsicum annuum]
MHVLMLARAHLLATIQQSEFHRRKAGLSMLELIDLGELRAIEIYLVKMPVSSYPVQVFRFASKLVLAAYGLSAGACDRRLYLRGGFPSIVGHMIYDGYKWARPRANYQDFGLSGHILREMVHAYLLPGATRSIAQPSIEATSTDCDSTCPWIKALSRSRRRCATGLTLFLPAWGVAMDAKMKTPQRQLGVDPIFRTGFIGLDKAFTAFTKGSFVGSVCLEAEGLEEG